MKAVGIITEYNPFHNGHFYHLQKAKELTGADVCVAVMSGNFIQRGEPAIVDKYIRCQAAVDAGVNLLVELPSYYALSSAELFADGAVKTLDALHVDSLVFGSECGDIDLLKNIAALLANEPDNYKELLKKHLSTGKSFPAARQIALETVMGAAFGEILSAPNNILGIEYLKVLLRSHSAIRPLTLARKGSGYHDTDTSGTFLSASALRKALLPPAHHAPELLTRSMPDSMSSRMLQMLDAYAPIVPDDFTLLLNYKLLEIFCECEHHKNKIAEQLSRYTDITLELGSRIAAIFTGTDSFTELALKIKSRQYTYSRICRCLMHIVLNIKKESAAFYEGAQIPYIRILGFDKKGQDYLSFIKKQCPAPIITKIGANKTLLGLDMHCAHIYNQIVLQKSGYLIPDEFRQGIYIKR